MSTTPTPRLLIVNADDFGQSRGVNCGIVESHELGIVTSASLMVRWPAAAEAAELARRHTRLSLGLHVDLGEWVYERDRWRPRYEVTALDDAQAVADEVRRQMDAFQCLSGQLPSHFDTHQHVHLREPTRSVLVDVANEFGAPLRHFSNRIRYCGEFYGQASTGQSFPDAVGAENLIRILKRLPEGVTELACHPGKGNDVDTTYRAERALEVNSLCDARMRQVIAELGIKLISFNDLVENGNDST